MYEQPWPSWSVRGIFDILVISLGPLSLSFDLFDLVFFSFSNFFLLLKRVQDPEPANHHNRKSEFYQFLQTQLSKVAFRYFVPLTFLKLLSNLRAILSTHS